MVGYTALGLLNLKFSGLNETLNKHRHTFQQVGYVALHIDWNYGKERQLIEAAEHRTERKGIIILIINNIQNRHKEFGIINCLHIETYITENHMGKLCKRVVSEISQAADGQFIVCAQNLCQKCAHSVRSNLCITYLLPCILYSVKDVL